MIEREPVDRIQLTVLIDNVTDPLLVDPDRIAAINWPKALLGAVPRAGSLHQPGSASARCCSTPACLPTEWRRTCGASG
jgi:hypothetical protein